MQSSWRGLRPARTVARECINARNGSAEAASRRAAARRPPPAARRPRACLQPAVVGVPLRNRFHPRGLTPTIGSGWISIATTDRRRLSMAATTMAATTMKTAERDRAGADSGVDLGQRSDLDKLCINTIRTLAMDAVQKANSGHPGTPMALAPVAYTLWQDFLRFDPDDPIWPNRDRFVLSNGHASMLLYAMLHLAGVKAVEPATKPARRVTLDDIKQFRQLGSRCPGHPEYGSPRASRPRPVRSARAVATASAWRSPARWLAAHFNRPGHGAVRLRRLRVMRRRRHDGRRHQRSGLDRRPPEARKSVLDLRQQPHHHRRQYRPRLQRRRGRALPRAMAGT